MSGNENSRAGSRVYGAGRFDPGRAPEEWASFGTHYFFMPREVVEGVKCATLTVCAAWDAAGKRNCGPSAKSFVQALDDACETLARVMRVRQSSAVALPPGAAHVVERTLVPNQNGWSEDVSAVINRIRASRAVVVVRATRAKGRVDRFRKQFRRVGFPDVRSALESLGRAAASSSSMVLDQSGDGDGAR